MGIQAQLATAQSVVHKRPGGGKSLAINFALFNGYVHGEVTRFMDADTVPNADTFPELVRHFSDERVAW